MSGASLSADHRVHKVSIPKSSGLSPLSPLSRCTHIEGGNNTMKVRAPRRTCHVSASQERNAHEERHTRNIRQSHKHSYNNTHNHSHSHTSKISNRSFIAHLQSAGSRMVSSSTSEDDCGSASSSLCDELAGAALFLPRLRRRDTTGENRRESGNAPFLFKPPVRGRRRGTHHMLCPLIKGGN